MRTSSSVPVPVVLVTGCSSGIGRATCDLLAAKGRRVFGVSRSACPSKNAWTYLPMDVTQDESIAQVVPEVHERAGRIDALVTAAGGSFMGAFEDTTIDEAKQHFDSNFFGTVRVIRAVLPIMREQRAGKIIVIGSIGGLIGLQYLSYYSAAKFALNGLVEALRPEVAEFGVQVSVINPGDFCTNISANELYAANSGPQSAYFLNHQRARDLYGRRVREAPAPVAVARLVDRLLDRRSLPVRLAVGSPVERFGLTAKRLLPLRAFEYVLRKNQGL